MKRVEQSPRERNLRVANVLLLLASFFIISILQSLSQPFPLQCLSNPLRKIQSKLFC